MHAWCVYSVSVFQTLSCISYLLGLEKGETPELSEDVAIASQGLMDHCPMRA